MHFFVADTSTSLVVFASQPTLSVEQSPFRNQKAQGRGSPPPTEGSWVSVWWYLASAAALVLFINVLLVVVLVVRGERGPPDDFDG